MDIKFEKNKVTAYAEDIKIGECVFTEDKGVWNIIHTEVDDSYQGRGIAKQLVECVLENAKKNENDVIADCSYAKRIIEKNKNGES